MSLYDTLPHEIDAHIEIYEATICYVADDLDYVREDGQWVESYDSLSRTYSHAVTKQAVLFAQKEGF